MESINRNLSLSILTLILLIPALTVAGGWTDKIPHLAGEWINDILCRDTTGQQIFIAGDNGYIGFSDDGGFGWKKIPVATINQLEAIDVHYDVVDTTIFVVGQAGTVIRIRQKTVFDENTAVPENLHTVAIQGNRVWIGGDNGRIYYSDDLGDTWIPGAINGQMVHITNLIATPNGIYATASWDTTTYILSDNDGNTVFDIVDSLQNVIFKSSFQDFGRLYFAGADLISGQGVIGSMDDIGGFYGNLIPNYSPVLDAGITAISGVYDQFERIWVSTENGYIYEADQIFTDFIPVYQNYEGRTVHSMAVQPAGNGQSVAWAAGSDGLMVRYDFMVMDMMPLMNGYVWPAQSNLQIKFTTVPDLQSIQSGIFIHSSVQGLLPFTAAYSGGDNTYIDLFIQDAGSIPGEEWTIIVSDSIKEDLTLIPFDKSFSYKVNGIAGTGAAFSYSEPSRVYSHGFRASNYVTGFFTEDEIHDVICVSGDSIYLYTGLPGGEFSAPLTQSLIPPLALNTGIPEQIRKVDINLDGMLDLVIFDDQTIQLYIKEPDAAIELFRTGATYTTNNLLDLAIFSADQDATMDFAVLNDSLQTRIKINENSYGLSIYSESGIKWQNFEVADVDADAFPDFVGLTDLGDIVLKHHVVWDGFDAEFTIPGPFDRFILGDIDDEHTLEILAQQNDLIRIFHLDLGWNFFEMTALTQNNPAPIVSFLVHDFNGDPFLDLILSTDAKQFKIFENQGGGNFYERIENERILDVFPSGMIVGEFDMDATLDVLAYDFNVGDFQVIKNLPGNFAYLSNFDSVDVSGNQVYLRWSDFQPVESLDYYEIYRGLDTLSMSIINSTPNHEYIDTNINPGTVYWYRVEAVDTMSVIHTMTGNLEVRVPYSLSGPISGVLSDTLFPYIVTGPLEVAQGTSLQILGGIKLLFEPGSEFIVNGNLEVLGSEEHFVTFRNKDQDKDWLGIKISGIFETDTIKLNWFDVEGAVEAFRVEGRPLKLRYAGINRNQTAFNISLAQGFLDARNIMLHKNEFGIITYDDAGVNLVNVTIAGNTREGIHIQGNSTVKVKNSVIYYNNQDDLYSNIKNGPDIRNDSPVTVDISFSTVDSVSGVFTANNLGLVPPLFQPMYLDSAEFIPDTMSATIDAGDPADDFSMEPLPNGGRVNQGVFGGTRFATQTFQPRIEVRLDTLFFSVEGIQTQTRDLVIYNTGNRDLEIFNLELHVAEFNYFDAVPVFIPPGDSLIFKIDFLPSNNQDYYDVLFIRCNDPHYPPEGLRIPLIGTSKLGNSPPRITSFSLINGVQDQAYIDTVHAFDPDGDRITFTPLVLPPWMALSAEGGLSGTPRSSDVANNIPVEIVASDPSGEMDSLRTFINVVDRNDPPSFITQSLRDATEDLMYIDTVYADDPDKDTLRFNSVNTPAWMTVSANGIISGTPRNNDVGNNIIIEISVTDNFGVFDTLRTAINVINTNDAPQIESIPDTIALALIQFQYQVNGVDIDGDPLTYSDDSPLFDIDPTNGFIDFTPALADTGIHSVTIGLSDGQESISETFRLQVNLTPVIASPTPSITTDDREITLEWKTPFDPFYTGTRITWSDTEPVFDGTAAVNYIDTTFTLDALVNITIPGLEIARTYYITLFNYFDPGFRIYSDPVSITATTPGPLVNFDFTDRVEYVPPGDTLFHYLTLKNDGAGTLIGNFKYTADVLINRWFAIDTSILIIAPGDSVQVPFRMHPQKSMLEIPHEVLVQLYSNQPDWIARDIKLVLNILFDHDAPQTFILAEPDSLHHYSALHFDLAAYDSVNSYGWTYGTATDSLRMRYKFSRITTTGRTELENEENILVCPLNFYPLPDGLYHLEVWVYDTEGNGLLQIAYEKRVLVAASAIPVLQNRWYLASLPREQDISLKQIFPDSSVKVYRWNQQNLQYTAFNDSVLKAGEALWVLSFRGQKIDISDFPLDQIGDSTQLKINKGWNQIGVPAGYHIRFSDLKFQSSGNQQIMPIDQAIRDKLIAPAVYWYRSANLIDGYEWNMIESTIATPWRGYWIYAGINGTLIFSRQPAFPEADILANAVDTSVTDVNALTKSALNFNDWSLSFEISNKSYRDAGNIIGITNQPETLPVYEPPHLDEYCSGYFTSQHGKITRDLRKPFTGVSEVKTWQFIVNSSSIGERHKIGWNKWSNETGVFLYLVDQNTEKIIDLSYNNIYEYTPASEFQKFTVYATMDAAFTPVIIPVTYKLMQNYPNPFNPSTTIKFGVPESGANKTVSLKIYNILGQEIVTLLNNKIDPGYHEIQWTGVNNNGKPVASGVYFYRLIGEGMNQVKKMILIR